MLGKPYEGIFSVDLFNDGDQRFVFLADTYQGRNLLTVAKVIKNNTNMLQLRELLRAYTISATEQTKVPFEVFDDINVGLEGSNSPENEKYGVPFSYVLSKWPNLDRVMKNWHRSQIDPAPFLASPLTIRVFSFDARTVFVAREFDADLRTSDGTSIVVVYSMTRAGPVDLCYLYMKPVKQALQMRGKTTKHE